MISIASLRRRPIESKDQNNGSVASDRLVGRGHSRPVDRARDRVRCHSPSSAHEDYERRMAYYRALSSGRRLVALCRHGAANADEHVNGHAWCTRRASVLEERVCLDDTLRRGLRYWRHHRRADRVFGWMDALRRAALCRVFGSVCSRLYFWYRVPIPSHPRHAADFAAPGAPGSNQGRHACTDSLRNWFVRLDGRGLFSVRAQAGANVAYLLVHDADRYGARLHRQL